MVMMKGSPLEILQPWIFVFKLVFNQLLGKIEVFVLSLDLM
jgi:hypothetical protein